MVAKNTHTNMQSIPAVKYIYDRHGKVVCVATEENGNFTVVDDDRLQEYICKKPVGHKELNSVPEKEPFCSTMTEPPYFPEEVPWDNPEYQFSGWLDRNPSEITRESNSVNHPKHYNSHPSGIECIDVARWYDFNIGNAIKYLWRHGLKRDPDMDDLDKTIEDLEKAIWYIKDEIRKIGES